MKLFYSPNSPYSRKCRVIIREKKLEARVQEVVALSFDSPPELLAVNPLSTVPALLDGEDAYCESPVICEYLDSLSESPKLYPASGKERFEALRMAALGDGIMAAAVTLFLEDKKALEKRNDAWISRKEGAILRTIETVAKMKLDTKSPLHIGHISLICALDYTRFRIVRLDWQGIDPVLEQWFEDMLQRPSFAATAPIP